MKKQPLTVTINMAIILLNAVIWLVLGIIIIFNIHPAVPDVQDMRIGLSIISLLMAGFLAGLVYFLRKHYRSAFYLCLAFFIFTSILVIFDEVGIVDIAFLIISVLPIVLLIIDRRWYLQPMQDQML